MQRDQRTDFFIPKSFNVFAILFFYSGDGTHTACRVSSQRRERMDDSKILQPNQEPSAKKTKAYDTWPNFVWSMYGNKV